MAADGQIAHLRLKKNVSNVLSVLLCQRIFIPSLPSTPSGHGRRRHPVRWEMRD